MDEPIYPLKKSNDSIIFHFESIGPKGIFLKEVRFDPVEDFSDYYQLILADIDKENNKSVLSESRNHDMSKIMATVIKCIVIFLENHLSSKIVFSGSTEIRTRLYRIIINKLLDKIRDKFEIEGFSDIHGLEPFNLNHEYSFFVISIKQ
jgi:hypothetical protein